MAVSLLYILYCAYIVGRSGLITLLYRISPTREKARRCLQKVIDVEYRFISDQIPVHKWYVKNSTPIKLSHFFKVHYVQTGTKSSKCLQSYTTSNINSSTVPPVLFSQLNTGDSYFKFPIARHEDICGQPSCNQSLRAQVTLVQVVQIADFPLESDLFVGQVTKKRF
jgi:hypothetical protein